MRSLIIPTTYLTLALVLGCSSLKITSVSSFSSLNHRPLSTFQLTKNKVMMVRTPPNQSAHQTCFRSSSLGMGENNFSTKNTENSYGTLFERPLLAVLDLSSLLAFASIGKASHSGDNGIDIIEVLVTALPFLIAWFVATPLLGLYNVDATTSADISPYTATLKRFTKGWVIAIPLGIGLRGIIKGYVPPTPFIVVTMISTWFILAGVRAIYSAIEQNSEN